ncbi:serine/threonine-protein kinase [Nocardia sp. XZ_19_369]|uniref:serine/threonine protein kinase n=1 Tax=Nocardia sp. XZ_19_369 TaxID=2769487 RepID=UPI001E34ADBA|nr:protein kinase [Nocardia sp. XZ_19_369]
MRPLGADDPTRIGDYRLLGVLGAGGMGRVYLGRNAGGRTVAVKVIRPDLVGDNEFRVRFRREVTAARRVGGRFTAQVLDADVDANPPWLATGYVAGFSLTEAVEEYGSFTESPLLVLAHGLAEALVAVHAAGLVHRDLKPSNVLLALDGPKVIDFGIARAIEDSQLTTTGKVIGSPGFMCPEQVTGSPVGPASDVFALGGVLVFAATGHGPFGVGEMVQMLWRVVYEEPELDGVPDRLRPLIAACLTKDPAARPTPERIIADLQALGIPGRGGWLPGPALEEVSRRAVELLDLDSGPFDVPEALGKMDADSARAADTVAQAFLDPNVRAATSLPGFGQAELAPRSWWQDAGEPPGAPRPPGQPGSPQLTAHPTGQTPNPSGQPAHLPGQPANSPGQAAQPPGQTTDSPKQTTHPPGQGAHRPGQTAHPSGQTTHLSGQTAHPTGQTTHPPGQTTNSPGQTTHLSGQTPYPAGQTTHLPGQTTPSPGRTTHMSGPTAQSQGHTTFIAGQSANPSDQTYSRGAQDVSANPPDAQHPAPRPKRRAAIIAAALALCLTVAVAAFVITKQIARGPAGSETQYTDSPGTPAADVPDAFIGEWKGVVEDKLGSYDIVLTLNDGALGTEIGSSANTGNVIGLKCGRAETLTDASSDTLTLIARLTEDGGGCNDEGATTTVRLQSDGTLSYTTHGVLGDMTGTLTKTS